MALVALVALAIKARQEVGRRRHCQEQARLHNAYAAAIRRALGVRVRAGGMDIAPKYRGQALRSAEDHERLARAFEHAAWRPWEAIPTGHPGPSESDETSGGVPPE